MPVSAGSVVIPYKSDTRDLDRAERRVQEHVRKVNATLRGIGDVLRGRGSESDGLLPGLANVSELIQGIPQLGRLIGGLVSPLTNAAQEGVRFNAFLETTQVGFTTLLGSGKAAQQMLDDLRGFAKSTPFQFQGLVESAQYMRAVGFEGRDVIPILRDVGDAISSTGSISQDVLQGVVRALGQMRSKGRVSAEEMEQLAERGIPAWEMLAHAIGKTVAETRKLSEQGRIKGPEAVMALMAESRSRFGGQMEKLGKTLTARQSNFEDELLFSKAAATETLTRDLSEMYDAALNQAGFAKRLGASIDAGIAPVSGMIRATVKATLGGDVTGGFAEGIDATKAIVWDAITKLGLGSINTLANIIGAHSPATEFIKLGVSVGEGFKLGIGQSLGDVSDEIKRIVELAIKEANRIGINPAILLSQIYQESRFKKDALSSKGARGVAQFMPDTARAYGLKVGNGVDERLDIEKAVPAMADLMNELIIKFGDIRTGLAAYNAGEGAVNKYGGNIPPYKETQNYVADIMRNIGVFNDVAEGRRGIDEALEILRSQARGGPQRSIGASRRAAAPAIGGDTWQWGAGATDSERAFLDWLTERQRKQSAGMVNVGGEWRQRSPGARVTVGEMEDEQRLRRQEAQEFGANPDKLRLYEQAVTERLTASLRAQPLPVRVVNIEEMRSSGDAGGFMNPGALLPNAITSPDLTRLQIPFGPDRAGATSIWDDPPPPAISGRGGPLAAGWAFSSAVGGATSLRDQLKALQAQIPELETEVTGILTRLPEGLGSIFGDAVRNWDGTFKGFFTSLSQGVASLLQDIAGQLIASQVTKLLTSLLTAVVGGGSGYTGLSDYFAETPIPFFGGGRAKGGPMDSGKMYLVGERGPELVMARSNAYALDHEQTARAMSNGGNSGSQVQEVHHHPVYLNVTVPASRKVSAARERFELAEDLRRMIDSIK